MAFINIFKKGEKSGKKNAAEKKELTAKKAAPSVEAKKESAKKYASSNVSAILKHAHITEKASRLSENGQYVFVITARANKNEVRKAVESYYNVDVVGVNIAKIPGKRHRRAKGISQDPDLRKAIVTIKKGQKIELLPR